MADMGIPLTPPGPEHADSLVLQDVFSELLRNGSFGAGAATQDDTLLRVFDMWDASGVPGFAAPGVSGDMSGSQKAAEGGDESVSTSGTGHGVVESAGNGSGGGDGGGGPANGATVAGAQATMHTATDTPMLDALTPGAGMPCMNTKRGGWGAAAAPEAAFASLPRGDIGCEPGSRAGGAKSSRYRQRKAAMNGLEAEASSKLKLARQMEAENRRLKLRTAAMEHTLAARDKQLSILTDFRNMASASGEAAQKPEVEFMQRAAEDSVVQLAEKLRGFVDQATMLLLRVSDAQTRQTVDKGALDELAAKVRDFCSEMGTAFVLNPHKQFQMMSLKATLPDEPAQPPPPDHWDKVVAELDPTQDQVDEILACWDLNGAIMTKTEEEAVAARAQLTQAIDLGEVNKWQEVGVLQRRLATALLNQGMACRAMSFILFGKIFTPLQTARALVHSFPFFPNARELILRLINVRSQAGLK